MKRLISLSGIPLSLALAGAVQAGVVSSTLNVTAIVPNTCSATTTAVNFGTVIANANNNANGDVTVACASGLPYHISLDAGQHYNLGSRTMSSGSNLLEYWLYKDPQSEWGDSDYANTYSGGSSIADVGNGAAQPHTVYGQTLVATPPTGTYSDVIGVTINY